MPSDTVAPPGAATLFRHPPFLFFFLARCAATLAYQVAAVAIGWQVYALTHSAFDLGMIGLVQFLPTAILIFAAGHVVDRYDRNRVIQACTAAEGLTAAVLSAGSFGHWLTVPGIFTAVAVLGVARAFESPATGALLPGVALEGMVQKATAVAFGGFEVATIVGPALGGLLYAVSPAAPYTLMAVSWLLGFVLFGMIRLDRPVEGKERPTLRALFAGIGFVRSDPAILGTISLDLFAVLLGGATALLPIYAHDILHTGPWGLGLLRGAPAAGALIVTVLVARYAIARKTGLRMFQAVILFGLATIVFALSRSLILSLAALAVLGAADTVSVVIRLSLVQLRTPDAMRGRVGAVNYLFVGASNQLGEFESGMTAALFGAVPAALLGGIGTVLVALLWMRLFPTLRKVDRLE